MKVLHINAAPRGDESRTLSLSNKLLGRFQEADIDSVDLFQEGALPEMTVKRIDGKYALMGGKDMDEETKKSWAIIEERITQFLEADVYVVSAPMWNFGIPYFLKHYIDVVFQPGYLFRYGENGPEGLAKGKKMYVVSTRGGDYSPESPAHAMDNIEPYLRTAFGFVGIDDITFITAQPMDAGGEELRTQKIEEAGKVIDSLSL